MNKFSFFCNNALKIGTSKFVKLGKKVACVSFHFSVCFFIFLFVSNHHQFCALLSSVLVPSKLKVQFSVEHIVCWVVCFLYFIIYIYLSNISSKILYKFLRTYS